MYRLICLLMLICGLSPFSLAQATPEDPDKPAPSVQLTWEEIDSQTPTFPFEDEVNACIKKDRYDNHGIGKPCMMDFYKYCPDAWSDPDNYRPGTFRAASCSGYFTAFWLKRLDTAYANILAYYVETDPQNPKSDPRAPVFEDLQQKWTDWRDANCAFKVIEGPYYSHWVNMEESDCVYDLTALRALELEDLQRLLEIPAP